MESPVKKTSTLRLVFQGSIPWEEPAQAENYYNMLKEMVKSQSSESTLNGQIVKMLEPCCDDRQNPNLPPGVTLAWHNIVRRL